jgi:hypothetical protein
MGTRYVRKLDPAARRELAYSELMARNRVRDLVKYEQIATDRPMTPLPRHTLSLQDRLSELANAARRKAEELPPGPRRDELLRKVRDAEIAKGMTDFLRSHPEKSVGRPAKF